MRWSALGQTQMPSDWRDVRRFGDRRLLVRGTNGPRMEVPGQEPRLQMNPTRQLIDELYLDKIRAARQMSPEQKFFAGPRLFARCRLVMLEGLRHENPAADEQRLNELLRERLALIRRVRGRDGG